jgi:polysaccharide export outer membrane protein
MKMRVLNLIRYSFLILIFAAIATAQETQPTPPVQTSKIETATDPKTEKTSEDDNSASAKPTPEAKIVQASAAQTAEEKEILPYYKSYIDNYALNPTDVISIEVFGQCPNYCRSNITVPPTGKISFQLIKGGVFVAGKTIEQVEEEIKTKLEEYIIDPNVTVTLDKAMSVRYSVLGKVATPGVHVMERRMTIYEAIVESGGITKEGDKKKILLYRYGPRGELTSQIVNLEAIERGKAPMIELQAGDQVFVGGKGFQFNMEGIFKILERASVARILFGSPF